MLILARRINESIMIGDDIEIIIIDMKGDQVKLGIRAPKKISVHRKEIYDEIKNANIDASKSDFNPDDLRALSDYFKKEKKEKEKKNDDKE